ncbi:MAG TPA: PilW family protein [Burkholderiaceae bacterium]
MKRHLQFGFSLIEVMVGLAIGMLAMIVVMEVFVAFEGRKRTATGGADAQSNGAIALYMMERDARMAGWGIDAAAYGNCTTTFAYCDGSANCGGVTGNPNLSFAAARITDGGTGPDSITMQYFANPTDNTFNYPSGTTLRQTQTSTTLPLNSVAGCTVTPNRSLILVSQAGQCTVLQATAISTTALNVTTAAGGFNPSVTYRTNNGWPLHVTGASASCFNPAPNGALFRRSFNVDATTRQLRRSDNTGLNDDGTPVIIANEMVASDILDLQIQYGIAAANTQPINDWVDATAGGAWSNPSVANLKRIKAVRIAIVARSAQYEKPEGGGACTTTTSTTGWSSWATFNSAGYPADWNCYRYKAFETVVPLRNVIWGNL